MNQPPITGADPGRRRFERRRHHRAERERAQGAVASRPRARRGTSVISQPPTIRVISPARAEGNQRAFLTRDIELLAAYDRACQRTFKDQDRDESGQFAVVNNVNDGDSQPDRPAGTSRQAGLRRLEKAAAADPKARHQLVKPRFGDDVKVLWATKGVGFDDTLFVVVESGYCVSRIGNSQSPADICGDKPDILAALDCAQASPARAGNG